MNTIINGCQAHITKDEIAQSEKNKNEKGDGSGDNLLALKGGGNDLMDICFHNIRRNLQRNVIRS